MTKAMLLRVGIDLGCGGALAPIFDNGSFEFIPIPEDAATQNTPTYSEIIGRRGLPLSRCLPAKLKNTPAHIDPEFKTFTYGDPTGKVVYLKKLQRDDLLVFYAGLRPYNADRYPQALYIIGYFTVEDVVYFDSPTVQEAENACARYSNNAHINRAGALKDKLQGLLIVAGDKHNSRLLSTAKLISEKQPNKIGRFTHALSPEMTERLGVSGFIERSIPPKTVEGEGYVKNLVELLESR